MLATIKTATVCGLESIPIDVEVDVAKMSFPAFTVVGLPDKAIDEAKERVRSALKNSGAEFPQHRITVNLAPADLPKNGPAFDLPLALGLLIASEQIHNSIANSWFAGELSLDGSLRPIAGVLPIATLALEQGADALYIPEQNVSEAALVQGLPVYGVKSLRQLILHLTKAACLQPAPPTAMDTSDSKPIDIDMEDILGQEQAKRGLEIAAAGGHNILLQGLPGSGKTMLARAFPSILPSPSVTEALQISAIYSVCGLLNKQSYVIDRPFRTPHHTTSDIGLIGGGANPKPGEISLAHRGVLFLDEFAEFPRHVLEALRQPLEDGSVTISRAKANYTFPAKFQLVAAQNPCPCGHWGDPKTSCSCSTRQVIAYRKRISGPLLDRIDLFIEVPRVKEQHLHLQSKTGNTESSKAIKERVVAARQYQAQRFQEQHRTMVVTNADMNSQLVKQYCPLDQPCTQLMSLAINKYQLSARGYFKVIKIARTIADLAQSPHITVNHISEALQYRQGHILP